MRACLWRPVRPRGLPCTFAGAQERASVSRWSGTQGLPRPGSGAVSGRARRLVGGWRGPPGSALISGSGGPHDSMLRLRPVGQEPGPLGYAGLLWAFWCRALLEGPIVLVAGRIGGGAACIAWCRLGLFGPFEDFGPCIGVLPLLVGLLEVAEDTVRSFLACTRRFCGDH
ncbi:hypothetical protein NDU88_003487 [Pleurodeles waltl]|uniref:Uncharacterized protein n=1 Tax=Pleurodeles waltl TaxID=8319 RepID=A0AAV7L1Z1_PLEWA|nr:hypothetical protein NDU88_003487 [Pleurodeles waltl]